MKFLSETHKWLFKLSVRTFQSIVVAPIVTPCLHILYTVYFGISMFVAFDNLHSSILLFHLVEIPGNENWHDKMS